MIASCVVASQRRIERDVRLLVVADAEDVVRRVHQEAIHLPAVVGNSRSDVRVVRIVVRTAGEVAGERIRRMRRALAVGVVQSGLLAHHAWQPTQEVVEATILHCHHNHVLDS